MDAQLDLFNQKKEEYINDVVNKTTKNATPIDPEYIKRFLYDAGNLPTDFGKGIQDKTDLLIRYFPKRFGPDGSHDIYAKDYTSTTIGSMFSRIVQSYTEKYNL